MSFRVIVYLFAVGSFCVSCATLDDSRKNSPHYHNGRFRNLDNDDGIEEKSFWTLLKWKWFTARDADVIESAPDEPPRTQPVSARDLIAAKNKIRITWIGHATVFVSVNQGGTVTNIITDPIFGNLPIGQRLAEMPIAKEKLPRVDAVVVSHSHYDHCDLETLRFLHDRNPLLKIILPEGQARWGRENGLTRAEDMRWWTKQKVGVAEIHFLPAHHWSVRVPGDRMQFHWGSYAFVAGRTAIYFAGDTAYSSHFSRIAERFPQGFAAALMPIGAYSPRWFMQASHVDPSEAVSGFIDLKAQVLLPMHWATFRQTDEKLMEPILYLRQQAAIRKVQYRHWLPGEAYEVDIR